MKKWSFITSGNVRRRRNHIYVSLTLVFRVPRWDRKQHLRKHLDQMFREKESLNWRLGLRLLPAIQQYYPNLLEPLKMTRRPRCGRCGSFCYSTMGQMSHECVNTDMAKRDLCFPFWSTVYGIRSWQFRVCRRMIHRRAASHQKKSCADAMPNGTPESN